MTQSAAPSGTSRRLVWIVPDHPPMLGGIGTLASGACAALVAAGWRVTVIVTHGEASERDDRGVRIISLPLRRAVESGNPAEILQARASLAAVKRRLEPDLYHVHLPDPSVVLHVLTQNDGPAPTITTFQNELPLSRHDSALSSAVELSTMLTGVSRDVVGAAARDRHDLAHRMLVVPNAIEPTGRPCRPPGARRLVAVGRLAEQKGFDRLIRAMPAVRGTVDGVELTIVGDGPLRASLESQAAALGVADAVTFAGPLSPQQVRDTIDEHDVFVMPSRHEGLPLAALEASDRARCVVGSDVGGINEVVVDQETGLLVPDGDDDALAAALDRVLNDPKSCEAFGLAARERVRTRFSLDSCVATYSHLYSMVLAPPVEVAIVVPVRNGARHLPDALRSIAADVKGSGVTCSVLVVDDGSTDDSPEISERFDPALVNVLRQPHAGVGRARNAGVAATNSEYIAHFDADDLWPAGRLAELLSTARRRPDLEAVFGMSVEFADPDAPDNVRWDDQPRRVRLPTAALLRRSAHDRIGGFDPATRSDQLGWMTRALGRGLQYDFIEPIVLERRIHASNSSHDAPFTSDPSRALAVLGYLQERRRRRDGT